MIHPDAQFAGNRYSRAASGAAELGVENDPLQWCVLLSVGAVRTEVPKMPKEIS